MGCRPEDVWQAEAWMLRRLGRWDESAVRLMTTLGVSPDNAQVLLELGITNFMLRRYDEAERAFDRTIALAPDEGFGYYYKAWNVRCWRGDIEEARRILESAPVMHDSREVSEWFEQEVFEGSIEQALPRIDRIDPDAPQLACDPCSRDLRGALALSLLARTGEARERYAAALASAEERLQADPEDVRFIAGRAVALAGLGRASEAISEAERAVDLCPIGRDALNCVCPQIHLALVLGMVGEQPRACSVLDDVLGEPAPLSTHVLRLDPRWSSVTRHPCFAELERKYPQGGAIF
jgi:tetratricopeptide (TPR) repeat protein